MVTLARPKPIIAQTYPRACTHARGIQLFESDVCIPPHPRITGESASVNIRERREQQSSRANNTERGTWRAPGCFGLIPRPF